MGRQRASADWAPGVTASLPSSTPTLGPAALLLFYPDTSLPWCPAFWGSFVYTQAPGVFQLGDLIRTYFMST